MRKLCFLEQKLQLILLFAMVTYILADHYVPSAVLKTLGTDGNKGKMLMGNKNCLSVW